MYEKIGCGLRGTPGTSTWKDVLKIASAARMNRELELMTSDPSLPPIDTKSNDKPLVALIEAIKPKQRSTMIGQVNSVVAALRLFNRNLTIRDAWASLQGYHDFLLSRGHTPDTVRTYTRLLKHLIQTLDVNGVYTRPHLKLKMIRPKEADPTVLTMDEIRAIRSLKLSGACDIIRKAFLFSMLSDGMRVSDALSIRYEDISGGVLRYRVTKTRDSGLHVRRMKEVILGKTALEVLAEMGGESGVIFDVRYHAATKSFAKIRRLAGIEKKLSFHVARYTMTDMLINAGVDIYTASKILGHSSVTTTERHYSRQSAQRMEDAFRSLPVL